MRKSLLDIQSMVDYSKSYPDLPSDLLPFYVYITDNGHSLMAIPNTLLVEYNNSTDELWQLEVPIPVKYVLEHVYYMYEGYIIVDILYNHEFGIEVPEGYEEY
ncbi:hypothetical protein D3C74_351780 [compost metagenome]